MKRKFFIIMTTAMVFLFTIMPAVVSEGAKDGLLLWFMAIVPSLLPFMLLSGILVKLKVTKYINRFLKPLFSFVFGVSEGGSYPVLMGFLAGCPVGAKTSAQLYKSGVIKKEEAQYLMMFCNNLSPMFLIEFIGVKCLNVKNPLMIFAVVAGSAVINAWIVRNTGAFGIDLKNHKRSGKDESCKKTGKNNIFTEEHDSEWQKKNKDNGKNYTVMDAVDESISDACETILKIGGYIILFSIITSIIEYMIPEKYAVTGCIMAAIFEVSTGAMQLAGNSVLSQFVVCGVEIKTLITVGFCAFGGISSVAQTYSVLSGTDLSIKKYTAAKIRQGFIAVILALLVLRI